MDKITLSASFGRRPSPRTLEKLFCIHTAYNVHSFQNRNDVLIVFFLFLCLTAYQPSWVILCQSNHWKRTVVVLLNPNLKRIWVHVFPNGISLKVNVVSRLEFQIAYYDVAVLFVPYFTTRTLSLWCSNVYTYVRIHQLQVTHTHTPWNSELWIINLSWYCHMYFTVIIDWALTFYVLSVFISYWIYCCFSFIKRWALFWFKSIYIYIYAT